MIKCEFHVRKKILLPYFHGRHSALNLSRLLTLRITQKKKREEKTWPHRFTFTNHLMPFPLLSNHPSNRHCELAGLIGMVFFIRAVSEKRKERLWILKWLYLGLAVAPRFAVCKFLFSFFNYYFFLHFLFSMSSQTKIWLNVAHIYNQCWGCTNIASHLYLYVIIESSYFDHGKKKIMMLIIDDSIHTETTLCEYNL